MLIPVIDAIDAFSSPTVAVAAVAIVIDEPNVACSDGGSDTLTLYGDGGAALVSDSVSVSPSPTPSDTSVEPPGSGAPPTAVLSCCVDTAMASALGRGAWAIAQNAPDHHTSGVRGYVSD